MIQFPVFQRYAHRKAARCPIDWSKVVISTLQPLLLSAFETLALLRLQCPHSPRGGLQARLRYLFDVSLTV